VNITVEGEGVFSLFLRIPAWADAENILRVNGETFNASVAPGSYVEIHRAWQTGDVVAIDLPMRLRRIESHPYVMENRGHVALMHGPLLYCVEQADNPGLDLRDVVLPSQAGYTSFLRPDLLGGICVLGLEAKVCPPANAWATSLYRTTREHPEQEAEEDVQVTAIPYYAWANREPGAMRVWLRTD
jgi:DUF1680 family protein